jgi:hypothetical protein
MAEDFLKGAAVSWQACNFFVGKEPSWHLNLVNCLKQEEKSKTHFVQTVALFLLGAIHQV